MKFDFYFFLDSDISTRMMTAVPDIQIRVIMIFIISPLIGESSTEAAGSLGISTVSEDDANIGSVISITINSSIIIEKTRFKAVNSSPVHF